MTGNFSTLFSGIELYLEVVLVSEVPPFCRNGLAILPQLTRGRRERFHASTGTSIGARTLVGMVGGMTLAVNADKVAEQQMLKRARLDSKLEDERALAAAEAPRSIKPTE